MFLPISLAQTFIQTSVQTPPRVGLGCGRQVSAVMFSGSCWPLPMGRVSCFWGSGRACLPACLTDKMCGWRARQTGEPHNCQIEKGCTSDGTGQVCFLLRAAFPSSPLHITVESEVHSDTVLLRPPQATCSLSLESCSWASTATALGTEPSPLQSAQQIFVEQINGGKERGSNQLSL